MSVTLSLARARSKWKSAVVVPAKLHRALPMHMLVSGPRSVVTEISQTALPSSKNSRLSGHDSYHSGLVDCRTGEARVR